MADKVEFIPMNRKDVLEMAIMAYVDEPCRICGKPITREDMTNHARFAGYSKNDKSRAAHNDCWEKNIPVEEWMYQ